MYGVKNILLVLMFVFGCNLFLVDSINAKENEVADSEIKKKKYRNPFSMSQKERVKNEAILAKLIAQATPKAGTRTKRTAATSKSVILKKKKIASINDKMYKIYLRGLSSAHPKVVRYTQKIKELNNRIMMIDKPERTMAQKLKVETQLAEVLETFKAKYVDFEPVPQKFSKDNVLRKKYKWLLDTFVEKK